ncbi:MAG: hypothetical protein R6U69_04425 [Marinobacter sp.]|uniref:hypothetical protein n=1 Tax=Marinobacter sp. TaxID=50741 RepID=UPI003561C196
MKIPCLRRTLKFTAKDLPAEELTLEITGSVFEQHGKNLKHGLVTLSTTPQSFPARVRGWRKLLVNQKPLP